MRRSVMSEYKDDIIDALRNLTAIESVAVYNENDKTLPFGQGSADALRFITNLGIELGLQTCDCDNYACHVQYDNGLKKDEDDYAAVLTHVDVVPAGDGWSFEPFKLTEKDGTLYGRGIADDKGAAIVSLFCLKAMKDNGIETARPIRCIFGGGEEIGMDDMAYYFSKHKLPTIAFTPDADYPMCSCEKGILHLKFTSCSDNRIDSLKGGSAVNCVADSCTANVICDADEADAICEDLTELGLEYICTPSGNAFDFTIKGISSHAMCPQNGINAIDGFFTALLNNDIVNGESAERFFAEFICGSLNGEKIGIDCRDEESGELTMNVGMAEIFDGTLTVSIDIRYPATFSSDRIIDCIKNAAADNGISVDVLSDVKPLYMPSSHPLIKLLKECYKEVTGQEISPVSTGGGTYARSLGGRGVAFGPVFADSQPANLHMPNENLSINDLMLHAEICYNTMCRLACQPDFN